MTPTDDLFWPYLLPIFENQKSKNGVAYVQKGDGNGMERMLEDTTSENVYPGIFTFLPKYSTRKVENHLLLADFNTTFYVWCKPDDSERETEDATYAQAEKIVNDIVAKLHRDSRCYQNYLDFDSIRIEPVHYLGVDTALGYEVKMKLALAANHIYG